MKHTILSTKTTDPTETFKLGYDFAKSLQGDEVIFMYGEAGAGKTVFTKGMASALLVKEEVLSPTFALVNIYDKGTFKLLHFDMYRISTLEEAWEAGLVDLIYGDGIKVIEWSENVRDFIDVENFHEVSIEYTVDGRNIKIERGES